MVDKDRLPKRIGNHRFTFVNGLQSNKERRGKYAYLRSLGFSSQEANRMRDYRQEIIDKRIAILRTAGEL